MTGRAAHRLVAVSAIGIGILCLGAALAVHLHFNAVANAAAERYGTESSLKMDAQAHRAFDDLLVAKRSGSIVEHELQIAGGILPLVILCGYVAVRWALSGQASTSPTPRDASGDDQTDDDRGIPRHD